MIYDYDPLFDDEADEFWLPDTEATSDTAANIWVTYKIASDVLGTLAKIAFGILHIGLRFVQWCMR